MTSATCPGAISHQILTINMLQKAKTLQQLTRILCSSALASLKVKNDYG